MPRANFLEKSLIVLNLLLAVTGGFAQNNPQRLGSGYDFAKNGKIASGQFSQMYTQSSPEIGLTQPSADCLQAAKLNLRVLARISNHELLKQGNLKISGLKLKETGKLLFEFLQTNQYDLIEKFNLHQIKGEDNQGNVHFTGYFTPILNVRKQADDTFKHPIYAMPKLKKIPSRKAIDEENALDGQALELGYGNSLLENYFLHVQGSGILDFGDNKKRLVGYAGQNGYPYRSIGKMLVTSGAIPAEKISLRTIREWFAANPDQMSSILNRNPSYTFFKFRNSKITGAAGISLTPMHSVAVDKKCIPYGACLIAEMPVLNDNGTLIGHKWQILFAHDTGGAIRGPGHLDLYHGPGKTAGDRAGDLHHYGRVWLMLAK